MIRLFAAIVAAPVLIGTAPGPAGGPCSDQPQDPPGLFADPGTPLRLLTPRVDAVDDLRRWVRRLQRASSPLSVQEARELDGVLADLTGQLAREPDRGETADLALLDLILAAENLATLPGFGPSAATDQPLERAQVALRARLKGPQAAVAARFLAVDVLQDPKNHGPERRRAAAEALGMVRRPEALPALVSATLDDDAGVAQAAQRALVGWDDPRAHLVFLDLIERREATRLASEHLTTLGEELGPQALDRLRGIVGRLYMSEDWRDAARAQSMVAALDTVRAAPILIEALAVWGRRAEQGSGSRRILEEIVIELRRLSGRNLGQDPALWNRWWGDVLRGETLLPEAALARGEPMTTASFFGLRLSSDRVIFVVDRSGSMKESFGTGGRNRYEEAVDQLFRFLESAGPSTRFGIALFHDDADTWRTGRLLEATESAQKQARRWLEAKRPKGGTALRTGLFKALGGTRDGRVEVDRLEADTVVVLCDGATAEGSVWVQDWLNRTGEELQLVIHGVQIGSYGDGTLEALATGSGGQFVRIER